LILKRIIMKKHSITLIMNASSQVCSEMQMNKIIPSNSDWEREREREKDREREGEMERKREARH
jgi:hypothetical protein